ncbi:MAG: hypothetical protein ACI9H6_000655 [Patiriisocius sp.]|jgi:hypothetical protein
MKRFTKLVKYKYPFIGLLAGICIIPLGLHKELFGGLMVGFEILGNLLLGCAALYTAWWARKTFAFKEKETEYKEAIDMLDKTKRATLERYGPVHSMCDKYLRQIAQGDTSLDREYYLDLIGSINKNFSVAFKELETFFYSLYFTPELRAELILCVSKYKHNLKNDKFEAKAIIQDFNKLKENVYKHFTL